MPLLQDQRILSIQKRRCIRDATLLRIYAPCKILCCSAPATEINTAQFDVPAVLRLTENVVFL
uniref:AY110266 n=1 Tax=Arundo donax TaxID=35708 RepID=A0A0A9E4U6_ARUDO